MTSVEKAIEKVDKMMAVLESAQLGFASSAPEHTDVASARVLRCTMSKGEDLASAASLHRRIQRPFSLPPPSFRH